MEYDFYFYFNRHKWREWRIVNKTWIIGGFVENDKIYWWFCAFYIFTQQRKQDTPNM